MDIRKETLHLSLYELFLYLANATMCIDEQAKDKVWNDMAYKLIEWNDTPRDELRAVFREFWVQFEELCSGCNEQLPEGDYIGNPLCAECKCISNDCPADCDCTYCQRTRPCECGTCEVVGGTCDKQLEMYETQPCYLCKTPIKANALLCIACEPIAIDTHMPQFLEVEEQMDKSYNGLYGNPTTTLIQNYGSVQAFRRITRSSHMLYGKYKTEKIQAFIDTEEEKKIEKE